MLPTNLFLLSAILIAGNFDFVLTDAESTEPDHAHDCPQNEVYSECGNNRCQNTCANPNVALVCKGICTAGCICADGLLRNSKGVCVNPEDCDTCEANEVFSPCGNHGCLNTCAEPDLITRCDYAAGCYPGCICEEGFLRDPSGNCIPQENCTCGENEAYSISGKWNCENSCDQPRKSTFCKAEAFPGCGCKEGYLRLKEGVCVLPEDCDNGCGEDPNAYFANCGDPCPVTCNNMAKGALTCESCLVGGGCKCKKDFVKDIHGKCVKPCDCPKCGANEVFACGSACDTTCATLGDTCPIVNIKCNDKCYCVDGYARDKTNVCIPIKQCPPKFTCPKTQVYNACPEICPAPAGCGTYLLGIESKVVCLPSDTRECKPKCECKPGLLLKSEKECVKPEQCCADPNAEVVSCPSPCPGGTCESPKFADCKAPCKIRGCQCKTGYVKDAQGKCIELNKCPHKCKAHEVFMQCGPKCQPTCGHRHPICTKDCAMGCFCKDGYIRQNGACILVKDCPHKCKAHEVFMQCGPKCQPTCGHRHPICTKDCAMGCFCKDGYIRQNGACILVKDCPKCGDHEVFKECGTRCQPTCGNRHPICTKDCAMGCFCKDGYIRQNEVCIPVKDCPKCGAHEVFKDCGTRCQPTCEDRQPICTTDCAVGCFCKDGYIRQKGVCIPVKDCPKCRAHEVYKECGTRCPPTCAIRNPVCTDDCVSGCFCQDEYILRNGVCIPIEHCPKCRANEVYACGSACDTTCDTLGDPCPIISVKCNEMCYCVKGYARDNNNTCIPIDQCPARFNCSELQVYLPCPDLCPGPDLCEMYVNGYMGPCPPSPEIQVCKPRCECKPGLYLKFHKDCVEPNQCCEDPNAEVVNCPNPCPGGTCESPEIADCGTPCYQIRGCQCKRGYVKDSQGKCIELSECPNVKCPVNEVYNTCPGYCTFDKDCPMLLDGIIRDCASPPENFPCSPRCECKEGFVRIGSECVLPEKCCADPNSELVSCPNPCPGGTCDKPEFSICKVLCKQKGCQCKKGFVKDSNGKCILLNKCPKCKKNEVWNPCPAYCSSDLQCITVLEGWVPECPPPPPHFDCVPRCECREGYVRISGKCVSPEMCCDDPNAMLHDCPLPPAKNCDGIVEITACDSKGCVCKPGYVLDSYTRKCVRKNKCRCDDPNAEVVLCPNPCPGGTCESPDFTECDGVCNPRGCQCKKGFVKDSQGICILLSVCPPKCKANEVYKECGTKCPPTCANRNPACTKDCASGCFCAEGYIRHNGTCIPVNDCPKCGANEVFACGSACDTTCATLGDTCPIINKKCNDKCYCIDGYAKDTNNVCISIKQCPPKCGANEVFACGSACDTTCATLGETCPIVNIKCNDMCYCIDGYARDSKKVCIPIKQCPSKCPSPNEQFYSCKPCVASCVTKNPICSLICRPGCACKPGYVKKSDSDEACIIETECPKKCAENEVYNACPSPCPPDTSCSSLFSGMVPMCPVQLNPSVCAPACRCKPDYVRNEKNTCVLPQKCCTDPNSELIDNPNCCPGGTCDNPLFTTCLRKCGRKGCQCKKGFLKTSDNDPKCILAKDCCKTTPKK